MKATALLCDYAAVHPDGKLTIVGANITRLNTAVVEPPLHVNFALAVLVEIGWGETNKPHQLEISLVFDGGEQGPQQIPLPGINPKDEGVFKATFNAGRGPDLVPGEPTGLPIALPFHMLPLPSQGGYSFKVVIDGEEAAHVPFQARVINPMGFAAA